MGNDAKGSATTTDALRDVEFDRFIQLAGRVWAVLLISLSFVEAILRLGARALEAVGSNLTHTQWIGLAVVVPVMCYFEGYRCLHRRFVPEALRKIEDSCKHGLWSCLLSPLYGLSLLGRNRRDVIRGWLTLAGIVAAVLIVREIPMPWRGIVDAGVSAALAVGLVSLVTASITSNDESSQS